jgi:hypothetical protein
MSTYYFLSKDTENLDYKLEVSQDDDSKTYTLYRIGESWSDTAKDECISIVDDGNGIEISMEKIDSYLELQELYIMIKGMMSHDSDLLEKYKILK